MKSEVPQFAWSSETFTNNSDLKPSQHPWISWINLTENILRLQIARFSQPAHWYCRAPASRLDEKSRLAVKLVTEAIDGELLSHTLDNPEYLDRNAWGHPQTCEPEAVVPTENPIHQALISLAKRLDLSQLSQSYSKRKTDAHHSLLCIQSALDFSILAITESIQQPEFQTKWKTMIDSIDPDEKSFDAFVSREKKKVQELHEMAQEELARVLVPSTLSSNTSTIWEFLALSLNKEPRQPTFADFLHSLTCGLSSILQRKGKKSYSSMFEGDDTSDDNLI